jgi:hypothetical protein
LLHFFYALKILPQLAAEFGQQLVARLNHDGHKKVPPFNVIKIGD